MESPEIRYSVSVQPTVEPITVADVKTALGISQDDLDSQIGDWITSAREHAEDYIGRAIVEQTLIARMRSFPIMEAFELPMTNLISVESIAYVDDDGATQTLATSVYGADTYRNPGLVYLKYDQEWPTTRDEHNAVTITYKAGFANLGASPVDLTDGIPKRIISAIIMGVGDLYENREAQGVVDLKKNDTVSSLLYPFRVIRL